MSLINQMLRDLDARRAGDEPANLVVADLAPVRSRLPSEAFSPRWLGVPLLLGCAALAAAQLPAGWMGGWRAGAGGMPAAADLRAAAPTTPEPASPARVDSSGARRGAPAQAPARGGLRLAMALGNAPAARDYGLELGPELRAEAARLNAMLERDPPAAAPARPLVTPDPAPVRVAAAAPVPAAGGPITGPLKRALPATPARRAEQIYERAVTALSAGDADGGEAGLAEALEAWPRHVKAREVLAAQLAGAGRADQALELLAQGQRAVPAEGAFARLRARLLVESGRLDEALGVLVEGPAGLVRDARYHALEAAIAQRLERHAQAAAAYRRALQARPSAALWWMGLAISLEAMRQPRDALRAFRQAAASAGLEGDVRRYVDSRIRALRG